MPHLRRIIRVAVLSVMAAVVIASVAYAHDFWLVPNAFQVSEGALLEVRGQTSSRFPTSDAAVTPDRVTEARVIGAKDEVRVTDLSTLGTSLVLRQRPRGAGQRIVAVSLGWRAVRASGPGFKRYIELEGNPALAARYEREGLLPTTDSITRRYAKYAKTIVQVGAGGPRAFSRIAGHPLEFVPLRDPSSVGVGDTLRVRVRYQGQPLGNARLHAGVAVEGTEPHETAVDTDAQGVALIPLARPGLWNVRTLHVVPSPAGSGADWESHFATMVWSVAGSGVQQDSADVVAVVTRYNAALAVADSSAALGLLAPVAIVLESGGAETLAEYRSHHLPADSAFAAGVASQRTVQRVQVRGDMAWVATTSVAQGEFRGRAVNSAGAELMVLTRTPSGWRIGAIHWSSRARRQQ